MTNIATINDFLSSPEWSSGEKWVISWQFGLLGDFQTALAKAIIQADEENLDRLGLGFPAQVSGFRAWAYGDLGVRLRVAGLGI